MSEKPKMTKLAPMMSVLFPTVKQAVVKVYSESSDPKRNGRNLQNMNWKIWFREKFENQVRRDILQGIITDHIYLEKNNINDLQRWSECGRLK